MIRIRISILVAISLLERPKENKTNNKKNNKKKNKTDQKAKAKKKNQTEKIVIVEESPKYLFEVGPPIGCLHIEYEPVPGRTKQKIDVLCWGPIAKVFYEDQNVTLKTFINNEIAWVPVTLYHVMNPLDDDEILKLYQHVINYNISTNKKKLGKKAKDEKSKKFFIREGDVESAEKFVEAFSNNPNLAKGISADLNTSTLAHVMRQEGSFKEFDTNLEFLLDPLHNFQINTIIDKVVLEKEVECKEFAPICPRPLTDEDLKKETCKPKKEKSKASNKSKGTTKKKKGDDTLNIKIPGEVFYTDPNLNIYDLKTPSSSITHAFIITTVANLMTRLQKYALNPLVIKIMDISNLPLKILREHRFKTIYASYNVPYIARCTTLEKPLAETVKFNESHAHFTDFVPKLKFLEFMQTQRLYIEIRGVRDETDETAIPNLFGTKKSDKNISDRFTSLQCAQQLGQIKEESTVTLAVACYDLSSLIKPTWDFRERIQCHNPETTCFQPPNSMYDSFNYVDALTINEVNLTLAVKPTIASPLPEFALFDFGTNLKIEVFLNAPHNALLEVSTSLNIYQRMLIVVYNNDVAMAMLNDIMMHNQDALGPDVFLANFLKTAVNSTNQNSNKDLPVSSNPYVAAVTGFLLDNGTSYAFFIEGPPNGLISDIWGQVMYGSLNNMKVFFNSDAFFERRLYEDFLQFGGVYVINLQKPLEEILKKEGIYLKGNVPIPCWEALKKLNLLFKCVTSRAMIQYCLFPKSGELLSLALEWGVPLRKKIYGQPVIANSVEDLLGHLENQTQLLYSSR